MLFSLGPVAFTDIMDVWHQHVRACLLEGKRLQGKGVCHSSVELK